MRKIIIGIMGAGESVTLKTYEKFIANLYGILDSHTEVKRKRFKTRL